MAEDQVWVINASLLILFSRIGQMDWFEQLVSVVWVPDQVIREAASGWDFDPCAAAAVEWATRHRIDDVAVPSSVTAWNIDSGESQVIAHALKLQGRPVLGDAATRRCARSRGLAVVGSIGVVLRAKDAGLIPVAKPLAGKADGSGYVCRSTPGRGSACRGGGIMGYVLRTYPAGRLETCSPAEGAGAGPRRRNPCPGARRGSPRRGGDVKRHILT